jgi:protein HOOK1
LKRLEKGLEKYFNEVLGMSSTLIVEHIEISAIARSADKTNLAHLMELVMAAIVKSPAKEAYISRILALDENHQAELMVFIQKILKKIEKKSTGYDEEESRIDLSLLQKENRSLKHQIEELQYSLDDIAKTHADVIADRNALQKQLKDLETEMDKRPKKTGEISTTILENQLSQKDQTIQDLRSEIGEIKKKHSAEISSLRDEIDVASDKILNLSKVESTLEMYKKRVEDINVLKNKIKDLEKSNKDLKDELKMYKGDIEEVENLKQTLNYFKEQHTKEKEKVAELSYKLEEKERDLKDLQKHKDEVSQKKTFLENKIRELQYENEGLKYRQDSGRGDEEFSLQRNMIQEYEEQIARLEQDNRKLRSQAGSESIINEINSQLDRVIIEKRGYEEKFNSEKRENLEIKRELETLKKEYNNFKEDSNNKIAELTSDINMNSEHSHKLKNRIEELEKKKAELEAVATDHERLKKEKEGYLAEMKGLFKEKDEVHQKVLESNEKISTLSNQLYEKDFMLKALELEKEKLENRLKEMVESEKLSAKLKAVENKADIGESNVDKIRFIELERDVMKANCDITNLKLELREKDDQLLVIKKEKEDKEKEHHLMVVKTEEELKCKYDEIVDEKNKELQQKISHITVLEKNREDITNSWNKEMKLMSIIVHEVGMEIMRANRTLKEDKTWLSTKRTSKN